SPSCAEQKSAWGHSRRCPKGQLRQLWGSAPALLRACARHHSSCVTLRLRFNLLPQPGVSIILAAPHSELHSHYLFDARFGWPGKGNDKGKVEGLVGYARRNFMVPIPVFESFEAFNAHLLDCCRKRMGDRLRGHDETIGERLERDLAAFTKPLPPPYDACEKLVTRVSSLSLVRYPRHHYSVPTI